MSATAVPHHYVITVQLLAGGEPDGMWSQSGVIDWAAGETRADQYAKVLQHVNTAIRKEGFCGREFVPLFWDLAPNRR